MGAPQRDELVERYLSNQLKRISSILIGHELLKEDKLQQLTMP